MRRIAAWLTLLALLLAVGTTAYLLSRRLDGPTRTFIDEADSLIHALQNYREFVGRFPQGTAVDIANALSGQTDSNKKVLVIANSLKNRNSQGEMLDPWGTPLQIYFSHNAVVIRSAGPNQTFEDSSNPGVDDLFRTDAR